MKKINDLLNFHLKAFLKSKNVSDAWFEENSALIDSFPTLELFGENDTGDSVVSRLCKDVISGEPSKLDLKKEVRILYAGDAAGMLYESTVSSNRGGVSENFSGTIIKISELWSLFVNFKESYEAGMISKIENSFEWSLFNTFRSYIFERTNFFPRKFKLMSDERGELFEMVKYRINQGQCFISKTKQGAVRGNHYHMRKMERFAVVDGAAEISLRKIFSDKVITFKLDGHTPSYVDMPTFYAHNIKNIGTKDLITAFWSSEILNPADTDTYSETV